MRVRPLFRAAVALLGAHPDLTRLMLDLVDASHKGKVRTPR